MPQIPTGTQASKVRKGPKFQDVERAEVLERVAALDSLGWSQDRIAKEIGVSQPLISGYLKKIRQTYLDSILEDRKVMVGRELRFLLELRRRAERALARTEEEHRGKTVTIEGEEGVTTRTEDEGVVPGSEYMKILLDTSRQIRKLLGLDEAVKVDLDLKATVGVVDLTVLLAQAAEARGLIPRQATIEGVQDESKE